MRKIAFCLVVAVLLFPIPIVSQMQSLGPKDRLESAKLSKEEIQEITGEVEKSAYDTPDSWLQELLVRRVDLGASPGMIVRGSSLLCGGTGNCQIWVFRKVGNKWRSMFADEQAPVAEGFRLGPALANGIKDFTIVTNSSAEAGERITYRFDGKFYRSR